MIYLTVFIVVLFLFIIQMSLSKAMDRLELRCDEQARQVAAQEAALVLQDQAHTRLSIMQAAALTDMREEVRKLRADRVWYGIAERGVS